jgi:two-component system chemotaxis response regulator CheY/two-component system cell cycle response regulator CpdR
LALRIINGISGFEGKPSKTESTAVEPPRKLNRRVLIAEDHETIAETYKLILEAQGYEVIVTGDGEDCIRKFEEFLQIDAGNSAVTPFELVVLDYHLPGNDGMEVAKHILSLIPSQRILMASSYPVDIIRKSAENLQRAVELLVKPFDLNDLADVVGKRKMPEILGNLAYLNGQVSVNRHSDVIPSGD